MAEQRQGTICFLMGLVALGGYLLIEGAAGGGQGLAEYTPLNLQVHAATREVAQHESASYDDASSPTGKTFGGWKRDYVGSVVFEEVGKSQRFEWNVSIYGLPCESTSEEVLVVHAKQRPPVGWKVDTSSSKLTESVSAYRRDREGNWTQALGAPTESWIARSLDCLLAPREYFASPSNSDATGPTLPLESWQSPTGSLWSFRPLQSGYAAPVEPGLAKKALAPNERAESGFEQHWLAQCRGGEQVFLDVQQQIRLTFHEAEQRLTAISSQVREKSLYAETRWSTRLEFRQETRLDAVECDSMAHGIGCWEKETRAYNHVFASVSLGQIGSSTDLSDTLAALQQETEEQCDQIRHPLIADGMRRALVDQATSHLRLQAAADQVSLVRAAGKVKWQLTDADNVSHDETKHNGKVIVMGFASDTRPESVRMLKGLAQIRKQWSECDVTVFNVVNFEHGVKASLVEGLVESNIVPLEDSGISERLGICHVGFPAVMVLNQQSELHSLCPWQTIQSLDQLQTSMEQLVRSGGETGPTRLTSLPVSNHNRNQVRVDRTHSLFGKNQNIDGTELFILAAGAYSGTFSGSRWNW